MITPLRNIPETTRVDQTYDHERGLVEEVVYNGDGTLTRHWVDARGAERIEVLYDIQTHLVSLDTDVIGLQTLEASKGMSPSWVSPPERRACSLLATPPAFNMKRGIVQSLVQKIYAVRTEIMLAEQALVTATVAFDVWMPSQEQFVALGGVQSAVLALLVAWYRKK